jgi:hypothetical protein
MSGNPAALCLLLSNTAARAPSRLLLRALNLDLLLVMEGKPR